jgi:hypothetical protein
MKRHAAFALALSVIAAPFDFGLAAPKKIEPGTTCTCICKRDADGSGTLLRQKVTVVKKPGEYCGDLKGAGCRYKSSRGQFASGTITSCS